MMRQSHSNASEMTYRTASTISSTSGDPSTNNIFDFGELSLCLQDRNVCVGEITSNLVPTKSRKGCMCLCELDQENLTMENYREQRIEVKSYASNDSWGHFI